MACLKDIPKDQWVGLRIKSSHTGWWGTITGLCERYDEVRIDWDNGNFSSAFESAVLDFEIKETQE